MEKAESRLSANFIGSNLACEVLACDHDIVFIDDLPAGQPSPE